MNIDEYLILIDKDQHIYMLIRNMEFQIGKGKIIVPLGFKTNLASVPAILEKRIPHNGSYAKACILHDYLYSEYSKYNINRYDSDRIFKYHMKKDKVSNFYIKLLYRSVLFCGGAFYKYKKLNGDTPPNRVLFSEKETNPKYWEDREEYRNYRRNFISKYGKI